MTVLNWKYIVGSNDLLDVINDGKSNNLQDVADILGISLSGTKKKIAKLKNEGKLIIHRYKNNNFIYLIGSDAESKYNAHDSYEIAKYRNLMKSKHLSKEILEDMSEEDLKELVNEFPLFDSELEEMREDGGCSGIGSTFVSEPCKYSSYEFDENEKIELDNVVDKLCYNFVNQEKG